MKPVEALEHTAAAKAKEYPRTAKARATPSEPGPANFVIVVSLENKGGTKYCVPRNIPAELHPGDTVTYTSPDGSVEVTFEPDTGSSGEKSPFSNATGNPPTVFGGQLLDVANLGTYPSHCELFDSTGNALAAWNPTARYASLAGGNVVVKNH